MVIPQGVCKCSQNVASALTARLLCSVATSQSPGSLTSIPICSPTTAAPHSSLGNLQLFPHYRHPLPSLHRGGCFYPGGRGTGESFFVAFGSLHFSGWNGRTLHQPFPGHQQTEAMTEGFSLCDFPVAKMAAKAVQLGQVHGQPWHLLWACYMGWAPCVGAGKGCVWQRGHVGTRCAQGAEPTKRMIEAHLAEAIPQALQELVFVLAWAPNIRISAHRDSRSH